MTDAFSDYPRSLPYRPPPGVEGGLVKRFLETRDQVLAFILALTRDYDAAEEIFQEVALVIVQEAQRKEQVVHFLAWAREVARHRVADYYRKKARRETAAPSEALAELIGQAFRENDIDAEASRLRMKYLLECLAQLSGRGRQVIEGFYRHRQSIKQLAAALAWQEASVKVALSRARKTLANCIRGKLRCQGSG